MHYNLVCMFEAVKLFSLLEMKQAQRHCVFHAAAKMSTKITQPCVNPLTYI